MAIEKLKREHIGARVSERAIKNCESLAMSTGLSFSRIVEKAMESLTQKAVIESMHLIKETNKL